jgi:hypothetical protein
VAILDAQIAFMAVVEAATAERAVADLPMAVIAV